MMYFNEEKEFVRYTFKANFREVEELLNLAARQEAANSSNFLLCLAPFTERRMTEVENLSHLVFRTNDMVSSTTSTQSV